jgi:hypothetical protein
MAAVSREVLGGRRTTVRCAIYTRKSTDEGLDQTFNTLDAQRDAAEAFIRSQRGEGWVALPDHYDDGGYTGANMDRPALQKLLQDVRDGLVDCVMVYKVDVLRATCGVFLHAAYEVAARYPEIEFDAANVDAMCMWLLKNPRNYDVIVTTNLFGDILSDLCAQMVGGMGFGYSGNLGDRYAVFEPTHGSAPKYAGMNKVNPIATILSAKMMLEWLGETAKAKAVEAAVAEVIARGEVRTYDLGGSATTFEMAGAIAAALKQAHAAA